MIIQNLLHAEVPTTGWGNLPHSPKSAFATLQEIALSV